MIKELGLTITDDGFVKIDTNLWTTQAELAEKLNISRNTVNNRVRRYTANGTLRTYYINGLRIRLIPNVNNINDLGK